MNTKNFEHLGFRLAEYLLILEPSGVVQKEVNAFKKYFLQCHRYPNAIVSKGHITLLQFIQYESYEQHIVRKLQYLADSIKPFDVELQGFGTFQHTLYVDVKSAGSLQELLAMYRKTLRPLLKRTGNHTARFVYNLHLTIARNLTPPQNEAIWPIWKRTKYERTFTAKDMVLLKRVAGTAKYTVIKRFNFLGIHPSLIQGKLFA